MNINIYATGERQKELELKIKIYRRKYYKMIYVLSQSIEKDATTLHDKKVYSEKKAYAYKRLKDVSELNIALINGIAMLDQYIDGIYLIDSLNDEMELAKLESKVKAMEPKINEIQILFEKVFGSLGAHPDPINSL